jgi:hypothetical protein
VTDASLKLAIYRRILSKPDGDDSKRSHRQTQPGKPRQARFWPVQARRMHAALRLVINDERYCAQERQA